MGLAYELTLDAMSRSSELLDLLGDEPETTSALYDRMGYPALTRLGLIPYDRFREALARLAAEGRAEQGTAPDGSTTWWRSERG
jgi:hypothetical protein